MKLEEVADVVSGRTFKHGIPETREATHSVIQLRDICNAPSGIWINWDQLAQVKLAQYSRPNELMENDILIVAKGLQKRAVLLEHIPKHTIVNQHFFIIRIKEIDKTNPEFLLHFLNSTVVQTWMHNSSSGKHQSTMSKKTLMQLPLPVKTYEEQVKIVKLTNEKLDRIREYGLALNDLEEEIESLYRSISDIEGNEK